MLPDDELTVIQAALAEPLPSGAPPIAEATVMDLYLQTRLRNRTMAESAVAKLPADFAPSVHAAVIRRAVVYYRTNNDAKKNPITRDMVTGWIGEATVAAQAQRKSTLLVDLRGLALPEPICSGLVFLVTERIQSRSWSYGDAQRWLTTWCSADGPLVQACKQLGTDTVDNLCASAHGMSVPDFVTLLATAARHGLTKTPKDATALFAGWDTQEPAHLVCRIWEPVIHRELATACGSWERKPDPALLHTALAAALRTRPIWQLQEAHVAQMVATIVEQQRLERVADPNVQPDAEPVPNDAEETADAATALSAEQIALASQDWEKYHQGGTARTVLLAELAATYPTVSPHAIATLAEHIWAIFNRTRNLAHEQFGPRVRLRLQQIREILQTLQALVEHNTGIVLPAELGRRIRWDELAPVIADTIVESYAEDPTRVNLQLDKRLYQLRWLFAALITLEDASDPDDRKKPAATHTVDLQPMLPGAAKIENRFGPGAYWAAQAFLLESESTTTDLSKKAQMERRKEIGQALCNVMARPGKTVTKGFQTLVDMTQNHLIAVRNAVARQQPAGVTGKARYAIGTLTTDPATAELADTAQLDSPWRRHDPLRHASLPHQPGIRPAALAMASAWFETPPAMTLATMHTDIVGDLPAALLNRSLAALQQLLLWGVAQPALQSTAERINRALRAAFPDLVRQPAEADTFETAPLIRNHLRTVLLEQLVERVNQGSLPDDRAISTLVKNGIRHMQALLSLTLPIVEAGRTWISQTKNAREAAHRGRPVKKDVSVTYEGGRPYVWVAGFYDPSYRGTVTVGDVRRYVEIQVETHIAIHEPHAPNVASVLLEPGTGRIFPKVVSPQDIRAIRARMGLRGD